MNIADYLDSPLPIQRELDVFFRKSDHLTIFDIGACEGEDSIRYKKTFRKAKVFSFEPLPKNLEKIKKTVSRHSFQHEIEIIPVALSDKNGVAKFYVSSGTPPGKETNELWDYGNKSSSLLSPSEELKKHHPWLKFNSQIDVKTQRMDSFCEERKIDSVDFIHMDVQGAELQVLAGAGGLLNEIKAIWLEVENVELYQSQPLKKEVEKFMHSHGFVRLIDTVNHLSGDQFYYNKNYVSSLRLMAYHLFKVGNKLKHKVSGILYKI